MTLKAFEIDGVRILAVRDPQIVVAMRAVGYIWHEVPDSPRKTAIVLESLHSLFETLAAEVGAGPTAEHPPAARANQPSQ